MSRRSYKAFGIALGLLWLYTIAGVVFAVILTEGVNASGSDEPRTLTIHHTVRR